jgi:hypothetical protein
VTAGAVFVWTDTTISVWLCMTFALMTWTYGIGAPTGLFVPSLAVGGAMGQIVGRAVMAIAKAAGSRVQVDLHTYAVVGAAAGLGGRLDTRLSSCHSSHSKVVCVPVHDQEEEVNAYGYTIKRRNRSRLSIITGELCGAEGGTCVQVL